MRRRRFEGLSPALRRHAAELQAADARLARAIEALARAERAAPPSESCLRVRSAARRRLRAAEAAEARAGGAVTAVIERIVTVASERPADLAFKLALLARLLGLPDAPVAGEPLDHRLLRAIRSDVEAAQR